MGTKSQKTEAELKQESFIKKNIPDTTASKDVAVKIEKNGREYVGKSSAMQYSTEEDMLVKEYRGSMQFLLATVNNFLLKKAEAVARQAAYIAAQGPAKKLYAAAGKIVRDSRGAGGVPVSAEVAFGLVKTAYRDIYITSGIATAEEFDAVEFDEEKINTGKEDEETEE